MDLLNNIELRIIYDVNVYEICVKKKNNSI